ncbi:1858_t:CDS:2, partial [Gigaspora margarita]
ECSSRAKLEIQNGVLKEISTKEELDKEFLQIIKEEIPSHHKIDDADKLQRLGMGCQEVIKDKAVSVLGLRIGEIARSSKAGSMFLK